MFIQLRLTAEMCKEPSMARWRFLRSPLFEYVTKDSGELHYYAVTRETQNKFGEPTKPHYHINICADTGEKFTVENFQKWFRKRPFLPSGNKAYSFKLVGDPDDEDRWWRYLLKEKGAKLIESKFPPDFDISLNTIMAQNERDEQIKKNVEARDRLLRNDSFRLKAFAALQKKYENKCPQNRQIFGDLVRYYQEKNKIPPFNSLLNMVFDYKVHTKEIEPETYFDIYYGEKFI